MEVTLYLGSDFHAHFAGPAPVEEIARHGVELFNYYRRLQEMPKDSDRDGGSRPATFKFNF